MIPEATRQFDEKVLRRAFSCFPSGVTAVCAFIEGAPVGMTASSFTSVSLDPPLVSVCVAHTSRTWATLRARPRLGVSVLAADHEDACRALAARSGDRFSSVEWDRTANGAVFVHGATAWLECSVENELAAGDHDIVLLRIHDMRADPDIEPLIFHGSRYRRLAD